MTTVAVQQFFFMLLPCKKRQCFKEPCISPFNSGAKTANVTSELISLNDVCFIVHDVFSK